MSSETRMPVAYSSSNIARSRRPSVGGVVLETALDYEEPVEAAHRGDAACDRPRREAARDLLADELLERAPIERVRRALRLRGKRRERGEVASVALDRVRGEPPF